MQSLIRSKSAGVTGGRGTAGAGPGRDLLYHVSTIFRPSMLHSLHPENNSAMSLPSGKEETEFLWHTWAKATLQMVTKGRPPSLSCYMSE